MFEIGASELLVIVIVAIVVIGPKEMPRALRTAGRWVGQIRRVSGHFRAGIDAMVREAELEDMEKKWKAQNEAIMKKSAANAEAETGEPVMTGPPPTDNPPIAMDEAPDPPADDPAHRPASAESAVQSKSPELPLTPGEKTRD